MLVQQGHRLDAERQSRRPVGETQQDLVDVRRVERPASRHGGIQLLLPGGGVHEYAQCLFPAVLVLAGQGELDGCFPAIHLRQAFDGALDGRLRAIAQPIAGQRGGHGCFRIAIDRPKFEEIFEAQLWCQGTDRCHRVVVRKGVQRRGRHSGHDARRDPRLRLQGQTIQCVSECLACRIDITFERRVKGQPREPIVPFRRLRLVMSAQVASLVDSSSRLQYVSGVLDDRIDDEGGLADGL